MTDAEQKAADEAAAKELEAAYDGEQLIGGDKLKVKCPDGKERVFTYQQIVAGEQLKHTAKNEENNGGGSNAQSEEQKAAAAAEALKNRQAADPKVEAEQKEQVRRIQDATVAVVNTYATQDIDIDPQEVLTRIQKMVSEKKPVDVKTPATVCKEILAERKAEQAKKDEEYKTKKKSSIPPLGGGRMISQDTNPNGKKPAPLKPGNEGAFMDDFASFRNDRNKT